MFSDFQFYYLILRFNLLMPFSQLLSSDFGGFGPRSVNTMRRKCSTEFRAQSLNIFLAQTLQMETVRLILLSTSFAFNASD